MACFKSRPKVWKDNREFSSKHSDESVENESVLDESVESVRNHSGLDLHFNDSFCQALTISYTACLSRIVKTSDSSSGDRRMRVLQQENVIVSRHINKLHMHSYTF